MKTLIISLVLAFSSLLSFASDRAQYYSSKNDDYNDLKMAPICSGVCKGYYYSSQLNIIVSYNGMCVLEGHNDCHCIGGHGLDAVYYDGCY